LEELVAEVNRDPSRSNGHSSSLTRINLDAASDLILARQGLARDSVPDEGRVVMLRSNSNLSTGGTATDVTATVHPRNAQLAELAAQILDLDVAGIDMICKDIGQPLGVQQGAIVEVNAAPGLRMHAQPSNGMPRDVGGPIVDMLYPEAKSARIPIVAITGTNGKTTVTRLTAHMHQTARKYVGMTSTDGAYINGELVLKGDSAGPQSARTILMHPRVEVAVLETARGGILREGLAFDCCSVGVVTNVSEDHLGLRGIRTIEDLARVKQVVVEAVSRDGVAVLNADDGRVAEMAAATDGEVIYFSLNPDNPVVRSHLAQGGRCVLSDGNSIVLARGSDERSELIELQRLQFAMGGALNFQVQNALAATAAGWGLDLNPALMARALSTFRVDATVTPGRFNIFDIRGIQVIVDYAHNPAAMAAFGDAVNTLGKKRTYLMLSLPGDRRDEGLQKTVNATLRFATDWVFYDGKYRRGRQVMEMPNLLKSKLPPHARATTVTGFQEGLDWVWSRIRPDERLVIIAETVDEALNAVRALERHGDEAACESPIQEDLVGVA
jgi:cyanophycin synthetase